MNTPIEHEAADYKEAADLAIQGTKKAILAGEILQDALSMMTKECNELLEDVRRLQIEAATRTAAATQSRQDVERRTIERNALAQAIHDARGILGFDNSGDKEPHVGDYLQYAKNHVRDAQEERDDREVLEAQIERGEAAETRVALLLVGMDGAKGNTLRMKEALLAQRDTATNALATTTAERDAALARVESAWDAGYTRGFYDREVMPGEVRDASEGPSVNPYRAALSDPTEGTR